MRTRLGQREFLDLDRLSGLYDDCCESFHDFSLWWGLINGWMRPDRTACGTFGGTGRCVSTRLGSLEVHHVDVDESLDADATELRAEA
ncbi:hypothetical protein GCM10009855_03550 [Gordonia cholesterolivorans]|uniref:Uncharacterized protein n=1 Tax=Gordonia cholesterolivorans TaxID=559625 RepID=A0ABN3H2T1_9ACTN